MMSPRHSGFIKILKTFQRVSLRKAQRIVITPENYFTQRLEKAQHEAIARVLSRASEILADESDHEKVVEVFKKETALEELHALAKAEPNEDTALRYFEKKVEIEQWESLLESYRVP